jgi:hypothetical protein
LQSGTPDSVALTDAQLQLLATRKIFFGHQSVGMNILQGVRDLMAQDPRLRLNIVRNADPGRVSGPALVESGIGKNFDPASKLDDFVAALDRGMGTRDAIAVCKLCYVDVTPATDVGQLFDLYRLHVDEVRARHPGITIVHVTLPLTADEPALKAFAKRALGRATGRDLNIKRNDYNRFLRDHYGSTDVIFDLAAAESTRPDGSRACFRAGNEMIYTLSPEFTSDGGHLNEAGRRIAAHEFLLALARASERQRRESAPDLHQGLDKST